MQGGKQPSCPFVRGSMGQEYPFNKAIYFSSNVKYAGMKIMNSILKSDNHCMQLAFIMPDYTQISKKERQ